jgi:signal transduction histidine kinase
MRAAREQLTDSATYRRLAYLLSAFPLGHVWFVALVTGWSLCLGLAITPLVIPLLIGMAAMTRAFATVEAAVAGSLLDVDVHVGSPVREDGFWARFRARFRASFWKAQAYLWLRWLAGLTVGVVIFSLLAVALGVLFAPLWVPFVHGGAHLGFWRPRTFAQSLALVPAGAVLLPLTILAARPVAEPFRALAVALLSGAPAGEHRAMATVGTPASDARRALATHAAVDAAVVGAAIVIWLATSRGYFWPIWLVLPLATALGIHAWVVLTGELPALVDRFRGNLALARTCGIAAVVGLYFIAIWAITGHGYFWPIWILLVLAVVVGAMALSAMTGQGSQAELTERIETLESSRAGAVDIQGSELRRIERDLHDGAQARLVALGMSLGMAEQKLGDDPEAAGALLAEARTGAEEALRELRDLARGIHPPVLADRGLEAALRALISATPMQVELSVSVGERPPAAVETCAYFVVAEALANAAKHANASRVDIRIVRAGGALVLDVTDNGVGGANPAGTGLIGLRQRVEAIDGTLALTSPAGGPTTVRAELPCAQ